ncbi:MAG: sulfatase-modifying factor protein [Methylobacter sp.]|nr:MAG: sulfatase-modifying factor protein [Methylobacter sp.]
MGDNTQFIETLSSQGKLYRWYWHPPELEQTVENSDAGSVTIWQTYPGFWFYLPPDQDLKPHWADTVGRERYGLYADVGIAGINQRFRWIQPGSFVMGSPKNEVGWYGDETQHQVNLSQGYWLADTACTQALWQAVLGNNPSGFKGANRPVEQVSWDDVQTFLSRLNAKQPTLALRLPTEAEWEYACRAETTGAFNFDGELTLDKANYRGTWDDYEKWGDGALQQTADVKTYPPNPWGLYEMHGNVGEWCHDWHGKYPVETITITDPQGPEAGDDRVLRGGSWFFNGRDCRSAYRSVFRPDLAYYNYGFRLALGHEPSQDSAGQQPAGTHASAARGAQAGDGLQAGGGRPTSATISGEKSKGLLDNAKDLFKK